MIGFEYKYTTSTEIIKNLKLLTEYSIVEYSILIGLIFLIILNIYYIFPIINIKYTLRKKEKEEKIKKEKLKLIIIQNKINQDIEKEIDIH